MSDQYEHYKVKYNFADNLGPIQA